VNQRSMPKYLYDGSGTPVAGYSSSSMMRFGAQDWYLVGVNVTDPALDTFLVAQTDTIKVPDNLDSNIGAALSTVQKRLEGLKLPTQHLTSGTTYREMVRTAINMILFFQRLQGVNKYYNAILTGKVDLDTQWGDIPQATQNKILNAAQSFGLDTSGLTNQTTI